MSLSTNWVAHWAWNTSFVSSLKLFLKIHYALTHWLATTLIAELGWTNQQPMLNNGDESVFRKSPVIYFWSTLWLQSLRGSRKSVWLSWGWEGNKRSGADWRGNGRGVCLPLTAYLLTKNRFNCCHWNKVFFKARLSKDSERKSGDTRWIGAKLNLGLMLKYRDCQLYFYDLSFKGKRWKHSLYDCLWQW